MTSMPDTREQKLDRLLTEREVLQIAHTLSRHVDRGNLEGMRQCFFPDAVAEYGFNKTKTVDELLDHFKIQRTQLTGVQHHITTRAIAVDGDYAEVENYVVAHTVMQEDDGPKTFVIGGRYLDKYERRDGEWKIAHRLGMEDWSAKFPTPPTRGSGLVGTIPQGDVGEADPSFAFFRLIK